MARPAKNRAPSRAEVKAAADRAEARSRQSKKKASGGDAPAKAADKVTAKDLQRMPPTATLKSLMIEMTKGDKWRGEIAADIAEQIAEAKKGKGVHPGALKRVVGLINKAKKTDRGLAAVATQMAHEAHYAEVLGLNEMLEKQGQMFTRAEAGEAVGAEPPPRGEGEDRDVRPDNLRHPSAASAEETVSNFTRPETETTH